MFLELGSYYFGIVTVFACLTSRREDIGAALVLLAAASWWVGTWGGSDRDVVMALASLATLLFMGFVTLRMATLRDSRLPRGNRARRRVIA